MARPVKRYQQVLRSYPRSKKINRISIGAEALYMRLLVLADAEGRYQGSPFRVASLALVERVEANEVAVADVTRWLDEMEVVGLILRYDVDAERFLEIQNYHRARDNRGAIEYPAPPSTTTTGHMGGSGDSFVPNSGTVPSPLRGQSVPQAGVEKEKEKEKEQEKERRGTERLPLNECLDRGCSGVVVERPLDVPPERWAAWIRQAEQCVQALCPRLARVARDVLLNGLRQAILQLLPPPPADGLIDPVDRRLAQDARSNADPVPSLLDWLRDVEKRAGEGRRGAGWKVAVLRGGPDPDRLLVPGFGRDPHAQQEVARA